MKIEVYDKFNGNNMKTIGVPKAQKENPIKNQHSRISLL